MLARSQRHSIGLVPHMRSSKEDGSSNAVSLITPSGAGRAPRVQVASAIGAAPCDGSSAFRFSEFHLDVARNSNDDFTPLHDPTKWDSVRGNPFGGPIVSVFQIECLIEYLIRKTRSPMESRVIGQRNLRFCDYHFTFTGYLRPDDEFQVRIQPSTVNPGAGNTLSNRVFVRRNGELVLAGSVTQSGSLRCPTSVGMPKVSGIENETDITYVPETEYFLKRKYLSTSNAKNFATGCLVDQAFYFDEVRDRVSFPDMVPVSYLSSALFEKNMADNIDVREHPTVHARHSISVDQTLVRDLRSNDKLHVLVAGPEEVLPPSALGQFKVTAQRYDCFCLVRDNQLLFCAQLFLVPLSALGPLRLSTST